MTPAAFTPPRASIPSWRDRLFVVSWRRRWRYLRTLPPVEREVQAGLVPGDPRFTPLPAITDHLLSRGFLLTGIFEQSGWTNRHAAEFCNALFVRTAWRSP